MTGSGEDFSENTNIVSGDTLSGRLREAGDAPPTFVCLIGPPAYVGKMFPLNQPILQIGRAPECQIHIDDKSVSRNHARIAVLPSEVQVMDLNSANKTVINGIRLQPGIEFKLKDNDQVKCGNVIFKFLEKGNIEAITNQQLNEKAVKDPLTGAYTKGALIERGPEVMKRAETLSEELSLIVFDIDFFKKVNDNFGHPGGDFVLKELGQIMLNRVTRTTDFFARYGGEEFVLILLNTSTLAAAEVAERIRQTIEAKEFIFEGKRIPVTVSLGIATRGPLDQTWEDLFKRADEALYRAKQEGRNRVILAS